MASVPRLRFDMVRVDTGPRIHYAEQGDPDGTPILFLHGWPDSWFTFSLVLPLLSDGIRAIVPDQRGFGDSERPGSGYAIDDFAADVAALLDALCVERATLVGHSFGSFVARRVAIAAPQRVAGLVLIGTGFTGSNAVLRGLQASLRDLPDPIPSEFARDFQASTAYLPVADAFFDRVVSESLKLPAPLWREIIDRLMEYDDEAQLAQLTVPTLLLWGGRDALFSRGEQDRFIAAQPKARLTLLPETGHCPNWERPAEVAAVLHSFLGMS